MTGWRRWLAWLVESPRVHLAVGLVLILTGLFEITETILVLCYP